MNVLTSLLRNVTHLNGKTPFIMPPETVHYPVTLDFVPEPVAFWLLIITAWLGRLPSKGCICPHCILESIQRLDGLTRSTNAALSSLQAASSLVTADPPGVCIMQQPNSPMKLAVQPR